MIWHIGLIMQGLTAVSRTEQLVILQTCLATDAGTGFMHEGFDADDPRHFTRPWFAWAKSLFAELVLRIFGDG
jgi:meiotically up-regulated gene 157 (Mug157) protein